MNGKFPSVGGSQRNRWLHGVVCRTENVPDQLRDISSKSDRTVEKQVRQPHLLKEPSCELRRSRHDGYFECSACFVCNRHGSGKISWVPPFPHLCRQIGENGKEIFGKGELDRKIDEAVATAVKKKEVTTKIWKKGASAEMADCLFADSSLLTPFAWFTKKQVEKSQKKIKLIDENKEHACKVTESNRGKVKLKYPMHHKVCDCVNCNPKGLTTREIPTPPSLPGCSAKKWFGKNAEESTQKSHISRENYWRASHKMKHALNWKIRTSRRYCTRLAKSSLRSWPPIASIERQEPELWLEDHKKYINDDRPHPCTHDVVSSRLCRADIYTQLSRAVKRCMWQ